MNLGGGYKVGRNPDEKTTDLQEIGAPVTDAFREFAKENGRELHLEIEPGTYLVANAGALVTTIQDKVRIQFSSGATIFIVIFCEESIRLFHPILFLQVSTKSSSNDDGHIFLKMDAGMTDVLRPSLYGAIHPITILPSSGKSSDIGTSTESVVVVGHCCESGDLMTPKPGEPEALEERILRKAEIGDIAVMDGSGAYCAGMSTKNYNSFPEAPEVLVDLDGNVHLIRKRQNLEQIYENELSAVGIF